MSGLAAIDGCRLRHVRRLGAAILVCLAAAGFGGADSANAQFFGSAWGGDSFGRAEGRREARRSVDARKLKRNRARVAAKAVEESSKAPPPRKFDLPSAKSVLVVGDEMAAWLGYGLEQISEEARAFRIIRQTQVGARLLADERTDAAWLQQLQAAIAEHAPQAIVVMIGSRDLSVRRDAGSQSAPDPESETAERSSAETSRTEGSQAGKSERLYAARADHIISVARAAGVPVLWVGLPPMRASRGDADAAVLNRVLNNSAARGGARFVDIRQAFASEDGDYSAKGPDMAGKVRTLRSPDGVNFTFAGARKLAHFIDRELHHALDQAVGATSAGTDGASVPATAEQPARPLAGPVIALTPPKVAAEPLAGGDGATAVPSLTNTSPAPTARADNFAWPRPSVAQIGRISPAEAPAIVVSSIEPAAVATQSETKPAEAKPMRENTGQAVRSRRVTRSVNPPGQRRASRRTVRHDTGVSAASRIPSLFSGAGW